MTKYNEILITAEIDNIININFQDFKILKSEIKKWQNEINSLNERIKVIEILLNNKTQTFKDIDKIRIDKDKLVLLVKSLKITLTDFLPDKNSNTSLEVHYKNILKNFNDKLKYAYEIIIALQEVIHNDYAKKYLPTYNGLGATILKSQKELFTSCYTQAKDNGKDILQKLIIDFVNDDKDLNTLKKIEILQFINQGNYKKALNNYIISPLTKEEKRILRTLRSIVYKKIQVGKITGIGQTVYEIYITYNEFFNEYGINKRKKTKKTNAPSGYDYKTTKTIKNVLFGISTKGLHKEILLKHKTLLRTSLILQIQEIIEKINILKQGVGIGFIILMPTFLFVSTEKIKAKEYYNQDQEGWKRFMSIGKMCQSEAASNIAHNIEFLIHNKSEIILNLDKLVEIAEYKERYIKSPTEVQEKIEKILDNLIISKFLINKRISKVGKFEQIQYILTRLNSKYKNI